MFREFVRENISDLLEYISMILLGDVYKGLGFILGKNFGVPRWRENFSKDFNVVLVNNVYNSGLEVALGKYLGT